MTNDTKLQVNQNTITKSLIIPILANTNANPINSEIYVNSTTNHIFIFKIMHRNKLYKLYKFLLFT